MPPLYSRQQPDQHPGLVILTYINLISFMDLKPVKATGLPDTKYVIYLRKVQSANEIWNFSSLLEPFKLSNPAPQEPRPSWDETVAVRREICLKDRLEGTNISLDLGLLQCPRLQHSNLIKIHKTKPDLLPRVLVPVARSARSRDWIIWPQYINVWGMIVKNVTKLNGFYKCPKKWRR